MFEKLYSSSFLGRTNRKKFSASESEPHVDFDITVCRRVKDFNMFSKTNKRKKRREHKFAYTECRLTEDQC